MNAKDEAARLRAYAKEQGRLSRAFEQGHGVTHYRLEERRGEQVKVACEAHELTIREQTRQRREASRMAQQARRDANREAEALEATVRLDAKARGL